MSISSLCHSSITFFNHQSQYTGITHSDQDIITHQFHNKQLESVCNSYAKTQAYMQCGTMSIKNLVRRLGVHDKTNHTIVSQVSLTW